MKKLNILLLGLLVFLVGCASVDGTYTGVYETEASKSSRGFIKGEWEIQIEEGKVSKLRIAADNNPFVTQRIKTSTVTSLGDLTIRTEGNLDIDGTIRGANVSGQWGDEKTTFSGKKK